MYYFTIKQNKSFAQFKNKIHRSLIRLSKGFIIYYAWISLVQGQNTGSFNETGYLHEQVIFETRLLTIHG